MKKKLLNNNKYYAYPYTVGVRATYCTNAFCGFFAFRNDRVLVSRYKKKPPNIIAQSSLTRDHHFINVALEPKTSRIRDGEKYFSIHVASEPAGRPPGIFRCFVQTSNRFRLIFLDNANFDVISIVSITRSLSWRSIHHQKRKLRRQYFFAPKIKIKI